jgi:DNA polymerase sigma
MEFGLKNKHITIIQKILRQHFPDCKAWVFGSRSTNLFKKFSDLDIAIISNSSLETTTIMAAHEDFTASDLPIKVDIIDYSSVSSSFKENINKKHLNFSY